MCLKSFVEVCATGLVSSAENCNVSFSEFLFLVILEKIATLKFEWKSHYILYYLFNILVVKNKNYDYMIVVKNKNKLKSKFIKNFSTEKVSKFNLAN